MLLVQILFKLACIVWSNCCYGYRTVEEKWRCFPLAFCLCFIYVAGNYMSSTNYLYFIAYCVDCMYKYCDLCNSGYTRPRGVQRRVTASLRVDIKRLLREQLLCHIHTDNTPIPCVRRASSPVCLLSRDLHHPPSRGTGSQEQELAH